MALIDCPECGHKVSTVAVACPECGYPVKGRPVTSVPAPAAQPPSTVDSRGGEPVVGEDRPSPPVDSTRGEPAVSADRPPVRSAGSGPWWQKKPHIFDPHSFDRQERSEQPVKPVKAGLARRRAVAVVIGVAVFLLLQLELLPREIPLRWALALFGAAITVLVITKWPSRAADQ